MNSILICGAGKIGRTVAQLLAHDGRYRVYLGDIALDAAKSLENEHLKLVPLDISDLESARKWVNGNQINAALSCLPYHLTTQVAKLAHAENLHYFDLTEDTQATAEITQLANNAQQAFVPQCGLAPGFIDIVAHSLMQGFDEIHDVKLRCGALPQSSSNALQYALTWSTDGVINEYGNPCDGIIDGNASKLEPLQDLEELQIDGASYEAFNTSGGIGSLIQTYAGHVKNLTYKTIRYPGHCEKMRFLMDGLKLNQDRPTLHRILENAIPTTHDDVVIVYVSVTGMKGQQLSRESFVRKYYPETIFGANCTAIQGTTASGACCVIDTVLSNPQPYQGFVAQEAFTLDDLNQSRFGGYLCAEK